MEHDHSTRTASKAGQGAYGSFAVQLLLSAAAMYLAMYLMIASAADFYLNLNTLYMTAAMVAPMGVLMLALMPSMFPRRGLNIALYVLFGLMLVVGVWFTRQQVFVGNEEFLRSMIPHHSGAVLMCRQTKATDPEIIALCDGITRSQEAEIDQMRAILARL